MPVTRCAITCEHLSIWDIGKTICGSCFYVTLYLIQDNSAMGITPVTDENMLPKFLGKFCVMGPRCPSHVLWVYWTCTGSKCGNYLMPMCRWLRLVSLTSFGNQTASEAWWVLCCCQNTQFHASTNRFEYGLTQLIIASSVSVTVWRAL